MSTFSTEPAAQPAPASPTAAGPDRTRIWLIGGGAGIAAVVVTAVVIGATGGPGSPRDVVQAHVDAFEAGHYEQAYELLCREDREGVGSAERYARRVQNDLEYLPGGVSFRVGEVVAEDDGEYQVRVEVTDYAGTRDRDIDVVREDGEYRVCDKLVSR